MIGPTTNATGERAATNPKKRSTSRAASSSAARSATDDTRRAGPGASERRSVWDPAAPAAILADDFGRTNALAAPNTKPATCAQTATSPLVARLACVIAAMPLKNWVTNQNASTSRAGRSNVQKKNRIGT